MVIRRRSETSMQGVNIGASSRDVHVAEIRQSNEDLASLELTQQRDLVVKKGVLSKVRNWFNPKFIHVEKDGFCLFRAILVLLSQDVIYAKASSYSSDQVKNHFLIQCGEQFSKAVEVQFEILVPEIFKMLGLDEVVQKLSENMGIIYRGSELARCFLEHPSMDDMKTFRSFSDAFTGTLIHDLLADNAHKLYKNSKHYDVFLN